MEQNNTVLRGGMIYQNGGFVEGDLLIRAGSIGGIIEKGMDVVEPHQDISVQGLHILPGCIDSHVHFRDPGWTHKEDFHTGSIAAVAGGVTTVLDMPNTVPPTFTVQDHEYKKSIAREKSLVNFGIYMGTNGKNAEEILNATNFPAVKVYLNPTTGNLLLESLESLQTIFALPRRFALHAEGGTFRDALQALVPTGNPIYLCHTSLQEEVEYAANYQKKGANLSLEVCPHHLLMTDKERIEKGAYCCMKPPLATQADQDSLWQALRDGVIQTIATDHAPHTHAEKQQEQPAFGVPGVQEMLSLMLTAVQKGKIDLATVINAMTVNPARIFGMQNKGVIGEGYDADLVVVDMQKKITISNDQVKSRCGWTPYAGREVIGVPRFTFVGGQLAYADGEIFDDVRGSDVQFLSHR